jgi:hypothetical protein
MFKIPKQEHTAEFKELTVKRVKAGQGAGGCAGARIGRAGLAQLGEGSREGQAEFAPGEGGHAGANGAVAPAGRECAT